jgi:flagellar hook assembly protein FlgD
MNIYDALGRRVTTLVDEHRAPGYYSATWDGKDYNGVDVASGIYFCRLVWRGKNETERVVLLK